MTPFLFDRYIKDFLATFGVIISVKIITMEFVQNYIAKSNQRTFCTKLIGEIRDKLHEALESVR